MKVDLHLCAKCSCHCLMSLHSGFDVCMNFLTLTVLLAEVFHWGQAIYMMSLGMSYYGNSEECDHVI